MKNIFAALFCFTLFACGSSGGGVAPNINYLRDLPMEEIDTVNTSDANFSTATTGGRRIRYDSNNNQVRYTRQAATGNSMSPDSRGTTLRYTFASDSSRDGILVADDNDLIIDKYEQLSGGFHFVAPIVDMDSNNFNLVLVVPYMADGISATPYTSKPDMMVNYRGTYAIIHPPGEIDPPITQAQFNRFLHRGRFSLDVNFMTDTISGTAMNGTRQVGTFDMGEFRQGEFSLPIDPDMEINEGRSPEFNELINMTDLSFRMRFIGGENTDLDGIEFRDIRGLFLGNSADGLIAAGRSFGRKTPINNERTFHWLIGLAGEKSQ